MPRELFILRASASFELFDSGRVLFVINIYSKMLCAIRDRGMCAYVCMCE